MAGAGLAFFGALDHAGGRVSDAAGAIDVWYVPTDRSLSPTALHDCRLLLGAEELARWRRLATWRGRREYLLTRELVRTTLSRYAAVDPRAWRFRVGAKGRPEIADPPPAPALRFNVSHTPGLIVCAVAREREIGVDVEAWKRPCASVALAERFFSSSEAAAIRGGAAERRAGLFVRLWTLKEAYVKARGLGLAAGLRDAAFTLDGGSVRARFADRLGDDPAAWHFALLAPTPHHCVAVAARLQAHERPLERPLAIALRSATITAP